MSKKQTEMQRLLEHLVFIVADLDDPQVFERCQLCAKAKAIAEAKP